MANTKSSRLNLLLTCALVGTATLIIASGVPAAAQRNKSDDTATRGVEGLVTDASDKPVDGAVVQLKDMRTLQIRSFLTKADGEYHFSGLKTDVDYQVKADYNGMTSGSKTVSIFDNRKEPTINLKVDKKEHN